MIHDHLVYILPQPRISHLSKELSSFCLRMVWESYIQVLAVLIATGTSLFLDSL